MWLVKDSIYYTNSSFHIDSYSIKDNKFVQLEKVDKSIVAFFDYKGIKYFVN